MFLLLLRKSAEDKQDGLLCPLLAGAKPVKHVVSFGGKLACYANLREKFPKIPIFFSLSDKGFPKFEPLTVIL